MYEEVAKVIDNVEGITPSETLVLISLAHHKNSKTGLCCPSYELIMKDTRLSRGTVFRNLNSLKGKGLIEWVSVGNGTHHKHNEYILNLDNPMPTKFNCETGDDADQVQLWDSPSSTVRLTKFNCETDQVQPLNSNKEANKEKKQGSDNKECSPLVAGKIGKLENLEKLLSTWEGLDFTDKQELTDVASKNLKAFLKNSDWETRFNEIVLQYQKSPFLQGKKESSIPQMRTLNWIFGKNTKENTQKILSGMYADKGKQPQEVDTYLNSQFDSNEQDAAAKTSNDGWTAFN